MNVDDQMAILKLQGYVENCKDMERAKKICKAFLEKYDPPKPVTHDGSQFWMGNRDTSKDKIYWAQESIDPFAYIMKDKAEVSMAKIETTKRCIDKILHDIVEDGMIVHKEIYQAAQDERFVRVGLGVFKP